ncbi:pentatricopeptide repeat-containing protein [Citrus sinensis]|uniref:Pentatricopeptide repeat-containing protein n=1 Tax=Citrus sinensis TaxID=2711 RepID=A0ACB8IQY6_CITSI|nr:pentatricopeptide repeat-containing protein [Citrus sinensis]
MIDGYMGHGNIESAVKMLDEMPVRDAISGLLCLMGLLREIILRKHWSIFETLGIGLWMHRYVPKQDFKDNVRVCNTLMDVYSRFGCIEFARQVFQRMHKRTLVSWNSIIVGFAVNGFVGEALEYFNLMQKGVFKTDEVSFTGALTACSHAGLIEDGLQYFDIMKKIYRVSPQIEHHGCIVDL